MPVEITLCNNLDESESISEINFLDSDGLQLIIAFYKIWIFLMKSSVVKNIKAQLVYTVNNKLWLFL